MKKRYVLVIGLDENGGNDFNLIGADKLAAYREGDGTSGQDRECYSDDQDRDNYSAGEDDELEFAREKGAAVANYAEALTRAAADGGEIVEVVARAG